MNLPVMLKAIGEPTRFQIFQQLLLRKHCVRSLSRKLGIGESAVSQHLKILREAELVYGEKYGYHTHYMPRQEALDFLRESFDTMAEQSLALNRDPEVCQCEFRKENQQP